MKLDRFQDPDSGEPNRFRQYGDDPEAQDTEEEQEEKEE